jgi:hypothetical protein
MRRCRWRRGVGGMGCGLRSGGESLSDRGSRSGRCRRCPSCRRRISRDRFPSIFSRREPSGLNPTQVRDVRRCGRKWVAANRSTVATSQSAAWDLSRSSRWSDRHRRYVSSRGHHRFLRFPPEQSTAPFHAKSLPQWASRSGGMRNPTRRAEGSDTSIEPMLTGS